MSYSRNTATKSSTPRSSRRDTPVRLTGQDWYDYSVLGLMATVVAAIVAGFMGM